MTFKLFLIYTFLHISNCISAQTTFYAKPQATGNGSSWINAGDLQTLINNANPGDMIFVAKGTYEPASGAAFIMAPGVKIYGGFSGLNNETDIAQRDFINSTSTLQGNGTTTVVINNNNALDNTALLDGFTISGGVSDMGGGMYNYNSSPSINNITFKNNSAKFGGGMYNYNSSPVINNSTFTKNSASSRGGAVYNNNTASPTISNTIIVDNTSDNGGGIYNYNNSSPSINNVTFSNNIANIQASEMFNNLNSSPTIVNTIIYGAETSLINTNASAPIISSSLVRGLDLSTYPDNNSNVDPLFVDSENPAGPDGFFRTLDDGLWLSDNSPITIAMGAYENVIALPVVFASVSARLKNDILNVNWSTETEKNNKYFNVEISDDGKNFSTVGIIKSEANDGNSNATIHYNFSMEQQKAVAVLSSIFMLAFIGVGFKGKARWISFIGTIVMFCVVLFSCTKRDVTVTGQNDLFVRIVQADKDGGKSYSKIVKVINEQ